MHGIENENLSKMEYNGYIVRIENFEGPLDLLWTLIKRAKIDITEISISQITDQYVDYLRLLKKMNFQIASEFILMASELLLYKSKALLPAEEMEDEFFIQPLHPELIQKLLEYRKYKVASLSLSESLEYQSDLFTRENDIPEVVDKAEYIEVPLFDLINAFAKVLEKEYVGKTIEIVFDDILVSDVIIYITGLLNEKEQILFIDLFSNIASRAEIVAFFLGILEMSKSGKIKLIQHRIFGDIRIFRV